MKVHEKFMKKCLHLAQLGVEKTKTNPLVGCVIVHKGTIISEGYHEKFGGPHAEVNAINNVKKKEVLAEDVANGFLSLVKSNKTTAHILTIDGGNIESSLR